MAQGDLAQTLVSLAGIVGGTGALSLIGRGIYQQITGRAGRERARNTDLETQRRNAVQERDRYDTSRRKALEYASKLRGEMNEHNIDPGPWPDDLDRTLTPGEARKLRKREQL